MDLPGIKFVTKGEVFQNTPQGPGTERLLIFGTAQDGPLNVPTQIRNAADFSTLFGPAIYQNDYLDPVSGTDSGLDASASLPLYVNQAMKAGCKDIWVMRCTGTYAAAPAALAGTLSLRARHPGRIYNQVQLTTTVSGGYFKVWLYQPSVKGKTLVNLTFPGSSTTVSAVIDGINSSSDNRTVTVLRDGYPAILTSLASSAIGSGTVILGTLTGVGSSVGAITGTNGTRAVGEDYGPDVSTGVNGYATKLITTDTGSFDTILNLPFPFDVAVLADLYLDDQVVNTSGSGSTSIATDFVDFLMGCSDHINPCVGVIGCRPVAFQDPTNYISFINNSLLTTTYGMYDTNQRWTKAGPFMYEGWRSSNPISGDVFDDGGRLIVVAGPSVTLAHPQVGNFTANWHVNYAAWLTSVPPEISARQKVVPGIIAYNQTIPKKYADLLGSGVGYDPNNNLSGRAAYTVLVRDPQYFTGPLVLFDDPTAAYRNSIFFDHQTMHLVNRIESDLANALRPFIGRETSASTIAAMKTRSRGILDGYSSSGALKGYEGQGYRFDISMDAQDASLSQATVHLDLFPSKSLRSIRMNVNVRSVA